MTQIIIPGIGGSGEAHWQSLWQATAPTSVRIAVADCDAPDLDDWSAALDRAVDGAPQGPILLVAHSLGCLLVAHWAAAGSKRANRIAGAFLVAVPDPDAPPFPRTEAASFLAVPKAPLPFPALVLASSDDPYASVEASRTRALDWRAGFVELGRLGHVNSASALDAWPQGQALLTAFRAGLAVA